MNIFLQYDPRERRPVAESNYWDDGLAVQFGSHLEIGKWVFLEVREKG